MPTLLASITNHIADSVRDRAIISNVMQSAVSDRIAAHERVLEVERLRMAAIDEAEREARKEKEAQKEAREKEQQLIEEEQARLLEWESYVEPLPDAPEAFVLTGLEEDTVSFEGGAGSAKVAPERKEELEQLLAQAKEDADQRAQAAADGADVEGEPKVVLGKFATEPDTDSLIVESFWLGTRQELAPAAADGAPVDT